MKISFPINKNTSYTPARFFLQLSPELRRSFLLLIVVMGINSLLELISIASIFPFISAISNSADILSNSVLSPYLKYAGIDGSKKLIVILSGIFVVAVCCSGLFRVLTCQKSNHFASRVGSEFSTRIYSANLLSSYTTHLRSDSTEFLALIANHVNYMTLGVNYFLLFLSSLFTAFLIVCSLVIFIPVTSISLGLCILFAYAILTKKTKTITNSNSTLIASLSASQIRLAQESVSSFKDLILSQNELKYITEFQKTDRQLRRAVASNSIISVVPKYIIEAFGFVILASFATFSTLANRSPADTIAILGSLALSIQKLLPALQQIYSSWIHFSVCSKPTQKILNYLSEHPCQALAKAPHIQEYQKPLNTISEIKLENVSYSYPNTEAKVIDQITLTIQAGDVIGIVGETGSGKTTLQDIILSLIHPSSGSILVNDIDIHQPQNISYLSRWRHSISHVPQQPYIYNSTILNNIVPGASELDEVDLDLLSECIDISSLSRLVSASPRGLYSDVGENGKLLSGGQRQRIALAREIYKRKSVLLLDEATSALDLSTERSIVHNLASRTNYSLIIMIAHRLSSLVNCNRVIFLQHGRIDKILNRNQFRLFLSKGVSL